MPVLHSRGHMGYSVVWVPQSKGQHMMWYNRQGAAMPGAAQITKAMGHSWNRSGMDTYTFPGQYADLVGGPDQQKDYLRRQYKKGRQIGYSQGTPFLGRSDPLANPDPPAYGDITGTISAVSGRSAGNTNSWWGR